MITQGLLETVVVAYIEAALWSSTDENGEPLDGLYEPYDFADEANQSIHETVSDWLDLLEAEGIDWREFWSAEQLGHDFWLTRNRHGAGYWDRYSNGLGETIGRKLTELAHAYGESDVYVGDDGSLYVS